ncbi:N-6 DNA methylase [Cryobacterium sp. MDB2-33-2]|uniref:N-6 DNA methylase n=1 Tax=Cryobacterium sp. MDB2-33-2 TaxID=1259179 RepID=UPI00106C1832|nr:N-6 DNA methylase [Cryobacterium sp. MDB2-33-2]TFC03364.1 SAM-dependent DNA methyltransferase [Cryobacterium sp. MDB2-33-2]
MTPSALQVFYSSFSTRTPHRAEADIQFAIAAYLTTATLGLVDDQVAKVEEQTADGTRRRIDISYGRLIIEVKLSLESAALTSKAEMQLGDYLRTLRDRDGYEYAGVLTDGVMWYLYALAETGQVRVDSFNTAGDPEDRSVRLRLWLQAILLTGDRIPATPAKVAERLGTTSPRFLLDRKRLELLFEANAHTPEVGLKRQLWARLLRTALGTSFSDDAALFIDHTLLVLEAEIIAHLVVGLDPANYSAIDIASGEHFKTAQITNVVEADFFDWPAEVVGGAEFISSLVRELAQFDWADVSHDVLKVLYQSIIDPEVRKNLGEYYTPDWLAAKVIEEVVTDPFNQRVMDPACGSGTFLFHCVRRFLEAADATGISNRDALELLQDRVFGMDIHPVSAVLARVTYLLAIGPARLVDRGPLTIPVYLGDSVQWNRGAGTLSDTTIRIEVDAEDLATVDTEAYEALWSTGQQLDFPISSMNDPASFDRLVTDLADLAQTYTRTSKKIPSIVAILARHSITADVDRKVLTQTFKTLCELNAEGRDHIWGYFVRNQIRPIWFSLPGRRMDVLVGNPPWVAYRFMTPAMKAQFKAMSMSRNLWVGGKIASHQDLVALFIARVIEQFLTDEGKFGFVTPFAVLSRMQYDGFRQGSWLYVSTDDETKDVERITAAFETSWDLKGIRPAIFPVPAAVVFGRRSQEAVPVPMETTQLIGLVKSITEKPGKVVALSENDVSGSPYASRPLEGASIVPRMLFMVDEKPAGPLGRPFGTTNVISARSSLEKAPWINIPAIDGPIEEKFVHKTLLGSSIVPYRIVQPYLAVLPVADGNLLTVSGINKYQLLADRWAKNSALWKENTTEGSKLTHMQRLDYHELLAKQLPGAAIRVVYAKSGNRTASAIVTDPSLIIDHSLYWMATDSEDEAHYLVAILNSDIVAEIVSNLQAMGLFGGRHIDTLP